MIFIFSFWFTSLSLTDSRSFHVSTKDPVWFPSMPTFLRLNRRLLSPMNLPIVIPQQRYRRLHNIKGLVQSFQSWHYWLGFKPAFSLSWKQQERSESSHHHIPGIFNKIISRFLIRSFGGHGTSLVALWLRLHSQCRGLRFHPSQGTRSHMPQLKVLHVATKAWHSLIYI